MCKALRKVKVQASTKKPEAVSGLRHDRQEPGLDIVNTEGLEWEYRTHDAAKNCSTHQTYAMHFHRMLRELMCHREKIARDLDGVLESEGVVRCYTANEALAYAQLP